MRRAAALGVLLLGLRAACAQVPEKENDWVRLTSERGTRWLQQDLALPADLAVDAETRAAATDVAAKQIARMRSRWEQWARSQWQRVPASERPFLPDRFRAFYVNEWAAMHVQSLGAEADHLMLAAWQRPAYCRVQLEEGWFANLLLAVAQLPAPQRAVVWAAQDKAWNRLARREELPTAQAPVIPIADDIGQLVKAMRSQSPRTAPPMVPVLAWRRLVRGQETVSCPALQWWLQQAVRRPGADERALSDEYRYVTRPLPADPPNAKDQATANYPPAAADYGAEGKVKLQARRSGGRMVDPVVVGRQITVPGLEGERPIAFETLFDAAALQRVRQVQQNEPDNDRVYFEFVWRLQ